MIPWLRSLCSICLALGTAGLAVAMDASQSRLARGPWSGAITTTSAEVRAKLDSDGREVRLRVSRDPELTRPAVYGPVYSHTNVAGNVVGFHLTFLRPDTTYYYAFEVQGEIERLKLGRFHTFPVHPTSFTFAFASCGMTGSTNASYDCIRRHEPLFFLCTGDFHYEDITTNRVEKFHQAYDKVLASPVQAQLYREIPFIYMWDDHDFCGNNSDDRARGRTAVKQAYRDYFPHYPLLDDGPVGPIAQSFAVGRVKFLLTDLRSQRDPAATHDSARKSMLGPLQKEWFKRELLSANGVYPLIFWISSVPWSGSTRTNYYWPVATNQFGYLHHDNLNYVPTTNARPTRPIAVDSWAAFAHERQEIADFVKAHQIRGLVILQGDMHALAADDGSNSDFAVEGGAPIPVMAAAPLDRDASVKGGPYSQGVYKPRKHEGCFGLVEVVDAGEVLSARFSGRNHADEEQIRLTVTVPRR